MRLAASYKVLPFAFARLRVYYGVDDNDLTNMVANCIECRAAYKDFEAVIFRELSSVQDAQILCLEFADVKRVVSLSLPRRTPFISR